ncbi:MAG: deoxyribodipyrimidine photolyase, partial [Pseudomonadota bacterium]
RVGEMVPLLEKLSQSRTIGSLWSHQETGNRWTFERDKAVGAWCRAKGVDWHEPAQGGVVRRLADRNGWAKRFDEVMGAPQIVAPALAPVSGIEPRQIPTALELGIAPDPCPDRQRGGRGLALPLLGSFLTERAKPSRRAMSAPEPGAVHCSRLSPHLAWGTLSLREVTQATWARQRKMKISGERG